MIPRGGSYAVWFVLAAALHGGLLFAWGKMLGTRAEFAMSVGESIEMTLVEAAGEPDAPPAPLLETTPPPAAPEPEPEPEPEPIVEPTPPEPEMLHPSPEPVPPKSTTTPRPMRRAPAVTTATAATTAAPARSRGSPSGSSGASGPAGVRTQARPNYLRNPPPAYPPAAKAAGEQGVVLLSVSVTEDGRAGSVRLARSSGFPRLDEAARAAVQRWRFSPARLGTIAVASQVEVPVRFQIK